MEEFAQSRLNICNGCAYNEGGNCILCGCNIINKTQNKDEKCPHVPSFWGPYVEQKPYKQAQQLRLAEGEAPRDISEPQPSVGCIPCQNRH